MDLLHSVIFWAAVFVPFVGLTALVWTRISCRSGSGACCRRVFCGTLIVVGIVTTTALVLESSAWLPCSGTLSLMVIGATLDVRGNSTVNAF